MVRAANWKRDSWQRGQRAAREGGKGNWQAAQRLTTTNEAKRMQTANINAFKGDGDCEEVQKGKEGGGGSKGEGVLSSTRK